MVFHNHHFRCDGELISGRHANCKKTREGHSRSCRRTMHGGVLDLDLITCSRRRTVENVNERVGDLERDGKDEVA